MQRHSNLSLSIVSLTCPCGLLTCPCGFYCGLRNATGPELTVKEGRLIERHFDQSLWIL